MLPPTAIDLVYNCIWNCFLCWWIHLWIFMCINIMYIYIYICIIPVALHIPIQLRKRKCSEWLSQAQYSQRFLPQQPKTLQIFWSGIPPSCCKYRVKSSNVFTATSFTPITPGLRSSPSWRAPVRCKSRTALCTEHRRFFHRLIHNWNMVTTASSCLKTSKFYTKSQWILDTDCSGIHAGWCALEKKGVCQLIQSATGYRKLVAAI